MRPADPSTVAEPGSRGRRAAFCGTEQSGVPREQRRPSIAPTSAREALQKGASIARERRTILCWLPLLVTVQSEAHLALGERAEAMAAAREDTCAASR